MNVKYFQFSDIFNIYVLAFEIVWFLILLLYSIFEAKEMSIFIPDIDPTLDPIDIETFLSISKILSK